MFWLICSLTSAVYGFSAYAPSGWTWEKCSCLVCCVLAAASYLVVMVRRPVHWQESFNEMPSQHPTATVR